MLLGLLLITVVITIFELNFWKNLRRMLGFKIVLTHYISISIIIMGNIITVILRLL